MGKQMSRLKPINKYPKKLNVFHNMAFVIFCPKHRKIAVSDNIVKKRELAIWLPFVYLSSDIKKRITVEESIALILSDDNPRLTALYKKEKPFDSSISSMCSMSIKEINFGFTRSVCLVRLHSDNPVLQCCRKTSRTIWLDIDLISNDYIDCLWGPQLKHYIRVFDEYFQKVRTVYCLYSKLYTPHIPDEQVLKSLNITEKQIQLFYMDFIEHCFPSVVMSFVSFKDYLGKYGFKSNGKTLNRFFDAFIKDTNLNDRNFLFFEELLLGLAHIDPKCINNESRFGLAFRYYDVDRDGYLSKEEFREMIEDFHENETSDMIDSIVNDYWFIFNLPDRGMDLAKLLQSGAILTISISDPFSGHVFRILLKIISTLKTKKWRNSLSY